MAGYIFTLGEKNVAELLEEYCTKGFFSTKMNSLSPSSFEGTLADYLTMSEEDNIYFFSKRKIYGIGKLKNIQFDCKFCNYPNSCQLENFNNDVIREHVLYSSNPDIDENIASYRWICTFIPSPFFFKNGIDMDDILSYKPETFKMLRALWKLSCIKISDEENASLKEFILLRNQDVLEDLENRTFSFSDIFHNQITHRIDSNYRIDINSLLHSIIIPNNPTKIKHEMALEAAILYCLKNNSLPQLGHWDYLSHQVIASPFKPIDYMDKIDIYAYKYNDIFEGHKIKSKYMVIELKKDPTTLDTIQQVMKYVDWICKEYTFGDYSKIEAYVIAYDYDVEAINNKESICTRNYVYSSHPTTNRLWNDLKLFKYSYNGNGISLTEVGEISE